MKTTGHQWSDYSVKGKERKGPGTRPLCDKALRTTQGEAQSHSLQNSSPVPADCKPSTLRALRGLSLVSFHRL